MLQVVVGDYAKGSREMTRPPAKDLSKPHDELYDSCVDDIRNPNIFVVFDQAQSYPEYIVEFRPST